MKTADAARGKWRGILVRLGIEERALDGRHHACPCTGEGKDRFRFTQKERFFCACARGGDGFELLKCKFGWDFKQASKEIDRVAGNVQVEPQRAPIDARPILEKAWRETTKAGPEVSGYLASRGLPTPPCIRQGFRDYYEHKDGHTFARGKFPCMVARVQAKDGQGVSLHVTYLQGTSKADVECQRKVMSPAGTINGAAVRLYEHEAGKPLGIAEGIETAIAASILYNMPVWSVLNRNGIETFDPPDDVTEVHIFGDSDRSYAGQAGAYKGAERLTRLGRKVVVHLPAEGDWNDVLRGGEMTM